MCRRYFPTFWVSECRLSDNFLVWWLFALFFSSSFKHLSTETVLFNWFTIANLDLIPLFIWPRIILLTFPISVLVWFMSLHFRYLGIFSLWSLKFGRSAFSVAYIEHICYFVVFVFFFYRRRHSYLQDWCLGYGLGWRHWSWLIPDVFVPNVIL